MESIHSGINKTQTDQISAHQGFPCICAPKHTRDQRRRGEDAQSSSIKPEAVCAADPQTARSLLSTPVRIVWHRFSAIRKGSARKQGKLYLIKTARNTLSNELMFHISSRKLTAACLQNEFVVNCSWSLLPIKTIKAFMLNLGIDTVKYPVCTATTTHKVTQKTQFCAKTTWLSWF